MNQKNVPATQQIFMREFEILGFKAPAIMWGGLAGSILLAGGIGLWIYFNSTQE